MKSIHTLLLAILGAMFNITPSIGQTQQVLWRYDMSDGSTIHGMSDNGKWAVAYGVNDATSAYSFPKLVNFTTHTQQELLTQNETLSGIEAFANDVTDDGTIVAGCYNGQPAYFNTQTNKWVTLPLIKGNVGGHVEAITPDGAYAVGLCTKGGFDEVPAMWDIVANKTISLPNLPQVDLSGYYQSMIRITDISADGRYLVGCVSYSYPSDVLYFLYDRTLAEWDAIAFDYDKTNNQFTPRDNNVRTLDAITISPNGKWVAGVIYSTDDVRNPFRYNVESKTFENFNRPEDLDKGCVAVDNNGTIYAATPAINPSRSLFILHDNNWYGIDEVLKQNYGIDFYKYTGYASTGLTIDISADCKTMAAIAYISQENYQITLPTTFSEACSKVNLLSAYTASVRSGATVQKISNISLEFTRDIEINTTSPIQLLDENGNAVRNSLKFEVDNTSKKKINIGFRTTTLDAGKTYSVVIPEGYICLKGDASKVNNEIRLQYTGLGTTPIQMTQVSPSAESTLAHIDINTNPIIFTFNVDVRVKEGAQALLYRNDEQEVYTTLSMSHGVTSESYNMVLVYPTSSLYLYKNNTYRIVIPAQSLTDAAGFSDNDACQVTYYGSYERTYTSDDTYIYLESFEGGMNNVMLYDGDGAPPVSTMQSWGFTPQTAWNYAADDDFTNTCAVSHSLYTPQARSNDWMVTPQLHIPDDKCSLTFDAQSYKFSASDVLQVYIYACDAEITELDADIVSAIQRQGALVVNDTLSPGTYEERLSGDWQHFTVDLSSYAGMNVYIAFVNTNEAQSALFVTNIQVYHAVPFQVTLIDGPETVVQATSCPVKGKVTLTNAENTYSSIQVTLRDAQGETLQTITSNGLTLTNGSEWPFEFTEPLPLQVGTTTPFTVSVSLDNGLSTYDMHATVHNLAFTPTKRIVLEENTGMGCNNCPMGHLAIERLQALYADRFIPIAYHTYTGDPLESGMTDYAQYFLGLNASPTAMIQRNGTIGAPMVSTIKEGQTDYSFVSAEGTTWSDIVSTELQMLADADLEASATYDANTDRLTLNYTFTPAISRADANIGLLCIITEDGLAGYQSNKFYAETDSDLGPWAAGGAYAKSTVYPYIFNDVARALYPAGAYNGQTGLIPSTIQASEPYNGSITLTLDSDAPYVKNVNNCYVTCLAIDANTGRLINAVRTGVNQDATAIDATKSTTDSVLLSPEGIIVNTTEPSTVMITDLHGRTIATRSVNGQSTIPTPHSPCILVRITGSNGCKTYKLMR